ncbi:unnamed protein product [Brachionus calyciflorus]|uniref:Uncharacterized protein n=1 Tax=Brachionus calyciflorus TaxID=104777 RepID=A0A814ISH3_9BILA|nr:unnamed protein product [Brachionus calyciflorus]
MGQESSSNSIKIKTIYQQKYDDIIQINFNILDNKLRLLNNKIVKTRKELINDFDILETSLKKYLDDSMLIKSKILNKKSSILTSLNLNRTKKVFFIQNFKSINEILNENFFYLTRNFSLFEKIKYLKFYNSFEELKTNYIDDQCYNYIIIPLSRYKIFYCCANFYKKSFLKITDMNGVELHRRAINPNFYYSKFVLYGKHIAGIYSDIKSGMNLIEIYNDELEIMASKLFNHKLDLVYMGVNELVCKSKENFNLYFFLNLR